MTDEIKQDGKTVLRSEDGFSIPMFFNNLCGKNFSGNKYRNYIKHIASAKWASSPDESSFTGTVCCKGRAKSRMNRI